MKVRFVAFLLVVTLGVMVSPAAFETTTPPAGATALPAAARNDTWPSPPVLQNTSAKPGVVDPALVDAFDAWVRERDMLASSVKTLGHNSPDWK